MTNFSSLLAKHCDVDIDLILYIFTHCSTDCRVCLLFRFLVVLILVVAPYCLVIEVACPLPKVTSALPVSDLGKTGTETVG
jgi:hypothetical protein